MALFNNFPYTDLNDINLDYTLQKLESLYTRGEQLYSTLTTWQQATNAELEQWKAATESSLALWKTQTENSIDNKIQLLTAAINTAFTELRTQLEAHIAEIETTAVNAASAASDSATAAAGSATAAAGSASDAAASATAAAGSASDAADTAESLSESLDQIATNTSDINNLKGAIDEQTDILKFNDNYPLDGSAEGTRYINYSTGELGAASTATTYSHTDYIDVHTFTKILYKRIASTADSPNYGVAFYDSEKHFLSGSGQRAMVSSPAVGYDDQILTVPNDAVYARFTILNDTETYGDFSVSGLNPLRDVVTKAYGYALDGNLWNYGTITDSYAVRNNGALYVDYAFKTTSLIPVTAGEIIYGYGKRYACYDSDRNFIGGSSAILNSTGTLMPNGMRYCVMPSRAAYFRICAEKTDSTFQLYKGTIFDAYLNTKEIPSELTLYCIGDSITRGMYTDIGDTSSKGPTAYGYPYWIGKINNYTIVNLGESSSGFVQKGDNNHNGKDIVDNNSFDDAGIITIALGVNDWKSSNQSIQLGNMSSNIGDGTVIGNLKYMIETLCDPTWGKAKTAQIIVMLPLNENRFSQGDFSSNWGFGYSFRENKTLEDYRQAIKECADYYNIKVVDPETVCPINRYNIRNVLGDGLHPTLAFYKQMGQALAPLVH